MVSSNPFTSSSSSSSLKINQKGFQLSSRRTIFRGIRTSSNWIEEKSAYDTLVYNGSGTLEEDDKRRTQYDREHRVNPVKIDQNSKFLSYSTFALLDPIVRPVADTSSAMIPFTVLFMICGRVDHLPDGFTSMDWPVKKGTSFDQRGDMAVAAWAE
ncbi:hypothetical protein C5167_046815 [Papaver somniferum]|uniref:Uncharacterized protein n=1 Tax=Papaver somniferum TaxID=3469 RepID=A0A4Y7LIL2_PAPSO|nr:hypothetical protein C5167_046815 [Papaver somniferum]